MCLLEISPAITPYVSGQRPPPPSFYFAPFLLVMTGLSISRFEVLVFWVVEGNALPPSLYLRFLFIFTLFSFTEPAESGRSIV